MLMRFKLNGGFLGEKQKLITDVVIPYQENILYDRIPDVEKSHAIENFVMAAQKLETGKADGEFYGMVFQDSDVGKWLEAAAYSLAIKPDSRLEKACDNLVDLIGRAQYPDGYLNTYFTLKDPENRWTNLHEAHELYCSGHLIEAACAMYEATGKTKLLEIMNRNIEHIAHRFLNSGIEGVPGHPEIEMALMRSWLLTGNKVHYDLAEYFINTRGTNPDFFYNEAKNRNWVVWGGDASDRGYNQMYAPVREQKTATGHAVRALYLYSGMADLAIASKDDSLIQACKNLWESVTKRQMYITGGIGSIYEGEAFSADYHLPNESAYAETCAAISLVFFARRMLELEDNGEYADIMEKALYNGVLAGMELDGKKFFYVNPLEALPGLSGEIKSLRHALPVRPTWFACACCPPNVARLFTSLGRYAWGLKGNTLYSHLFADGLLDLSEELGVKIDTKTNWPHDGKITYTFYTNGPIKSMRLAIRVPSWSKEFTLSRNGRTLQAEIQNGYIYFDAPFVNGETVVFDHHFAIRRVYASTNIASTSGKVAFLRGPLVYCAEGVDNGINAQMGRVLDLVVKRDGQTNEEASKDLGGIYKLKVAGWRLKESEGKAEETAQLYQESPPILQEENIVLIPYYTWANRGLNEMRVWLPEA